jgi:hypothetical protein
MLPRKKIIGLWSKTIDGQTLFYPYGILGKGWVVPEPFPSDIAIFLQRWLIFGCALLAAYVVLQATTSIGTALIFTAPVYLVMLVVYIARIRRWTRNMEATSIRMSRSDMAQNQARLYPKAFTSLLLIFALIMVAGSAVALVGSLRHLGGNTLWSGASLVFFSFCLLQFMKIHSARKKMDDEAAQ